MLPINIGYGHLKLVITMLEITYGGTNDPLPKQDLEKFQYKSTATAPKVSPILLYNFMTYSQFGELLISI